MCKCAPREDLTFQLFRMAPNLINSGPKLDWTRGVGMYDRYLPWKKRCELLVDSILKDTEVPIKYWMGVEGVLVITNWESTNKIVCCSRWCHSFRT